jgi:2',3'-cyclic-nucleotide 2'-phosphodiesterase / 3'-nucleotidase
LIWRTLFAQRFKSMQFSDETRDHRDFGAVPNAAIELDVRIMATSDLHANILAWDYHANRPSDQIGLARVATLIRAARVEQPQSLLFDNGDFLHGNEMGDYLAETTPVLRSGRPLRTHPMIAAMNALDYDAAALGNHEFGYGLGFLRRSLLAADFPIVCSNLYFKPTRAEALSLPYVILVRDMKDRAGNPHRLRIGVLGFLPPQTMLWEHRYLKSRASVADIVSSARELVPLLRAKGADLVIALSHSGIGTEGRTMGAENASAALAQLPGIDAVIAGHTHMVFPTETERDLHGKPVVMPGFHGSHLGVIDLRLVRQPSGWHVRGFHSEVRPIARRSSRVGRMEPLVPDDPRIAALAAPAHQILLLRSEAQLGYTPLPLNSFFALVSDCAALRVVARAQAEHVAGALRGRPEQVLPLLSAVAPFKAGGRGGPENYTDVPIGPFLARHVSDHYIHPNNICALRLTGAEVALWLERSVSLYHQITPGARDVDLLNDSFPSFNFDMIDGLSYQIDLSQPPHFDAVGTVLDPTARRIRDLRYLGAPVQADQIFVLATNSYRASGGIGFAGASLSRLIYDTPTSNRRVLADFLREGGAPQPEDAVPRWQFAPMPETSVLFESAPEAAGHLDEVPHLRLEALEIAPSGFRRFRLWLG